jgi:iron complex outermembrane receptor protein
MGDAKRLSCGLVAGGSAGALALMSGVTNVHAAEQDMIAEVIVTAQKRAEALIDVPLSISVVGGDMLERQQAANFQDYLKLVPACR